MKRRAWLLLLALLLPLRAEAHIGSPDVFFDGLAGAYPVRVTIRMPGVVPGRAGISVQVRSDEAVSVSFAPVSSKTAIRNTPPPETAQPVAGQTNFFSGELWLMTDGAYSIDIRVRGKSGEGLVQIPVNSVAIRQLPLPGWMGAALLALGAVLFCGGVAIVAAAAGESVLPPETSAGSETRRRYWIAASTTAIVFALLLIGGKHWWNAEEADFRTRLVEGGWPALETEVRDRGAQRILRLTLSKTEFRRTDNFDLALDHGKLLHTYLIREPGHDVFAHIHPVRKSEKKFDVALPPLPEGDYEVLCDLTLADSGLSSTATNMVHIPAVPESAAVSNLFQVDPDDSWTLNAVAARDVSGSDTVCHLANGDQVVWKGHSAVQVQHDAGLRFEVRNAAGQPVALEPYMGMVSHAAVLRSDGRVFSHLHPSGNYSMAAQTFFDNKLARESGTAVHPHVANGDAVCGAAGSSGASVITLPYEFPSAGDYRIWVQFKTGGRIETAIFDTTAL